MFYQSLEYLRLDYDVAGRIYILTLVLMLVDER